MTQLIEDQQKTLPKKLVYFSDDGELRTCSLLVADAFAMNHDEVIALIQAQIPFSHRCYYYGDFQEGPCKNNLFYEMTRDGLSCLNLAASGEGASKIYFDFLAAFDHCQSVAMEMKFRHGLKAPRKNMKTTAYRAGIDAEGSRTFEILVTDNLKSVEEFDELSKIKNQQKERATKILANMKAYFESDLANATYQQPFLDQLNIWTERTTK